jgi:hypothetical protein
MKKNIENNNSEFFFHIIDMDNKPILPTADRWTRKNWIEWGSGDKKNLFYETIIDIYNERAPLHRNIIKRKVELISGAGIEIPENPSIDLQYFLQNPNDESNIEKIVSQIALDYELTDSFALGVIWGSGKNPKPARIYHIPIEQIRFDSQYFTGKDEFKYFWLSADWTDERRNIPVKMQAFRGDGQGEKEQVFLYQAEGKTGKSLYTIPYYYGAINWIVADFAISLYHNNQIQNDFSPGFHLYLGSGFKTEDQMRDLYHKLETKLTGPLGKKIFVTYGVGNDQKTQIDKLDMPTTDKRYIELEQSIINSIYRAHGVVNQMLFGEKAVSGSLAGASALQEDLDTYQRLYIDFRQRDIEMVLNKLAFLSGVKEKIKLKKFRLI